MAAGGYVCTALGSGRGRNKIQQARCGIQPRSRCITLKCIAGKGNKWWRCCFERGADGSILDLACRAEEGVAQVSQRNKPGLVWQKILGVNFDADGRQAGEVAGDRWAASSFCIESGVGCAGGELHGGTSNWYMA